MTPEERTALEATVQRMRDEVRLQEVEAERKMRMPLAYARLWHAEGIDETGRARTSQRNAIALAKGSVATSIFGGNATGKTEAAAMLAVATMLGADHPVAREWIDANHLPDGMLPPYPGRVLFSALTSNDSKRFLRPKLQKYLPAGSTWRNISGDGEAFAYVPVKATVPGGGCCIFKSNDQGADKYQGDEYDLIINDEEHDSAVIEEELGRLGRRPWTAGFILNSMTPLKGFTWVHKDFVKAPKPGYRAMWIHGPDNPHLDQDRRRILFSGLSAARLRTRQFGDFASLSGACYDMLDPNVHRVPRMEIPPEWVRFMGIDWGARSPHVLWAAQAPSGQLIVYREHAPRRTTTEPGITDARLVGHIMDTERQGGESPVSTWYRVADSESPGAIEEAASQGLYLIPAAKGPGSVMAGMELTQAQLCLLDAYTGEERQPGILITEDCPVLWEEMTGMRWAPAKEGQEAKPDPSCPDHGPDALRYLVQLRLAMGFR